MYAIGNLTNFAEFTSFSKAVGIPLISITVGLGVGFAWEWRQSLINPKIFDWNDIERTVIGCVIGGILSVLIPNVQWLIVLTVIISGCLIVNDLRK